MFTVALIGPDGAGKTTIGRRLEHALPRPVKYIYMGVNLDSSNVMLPTTRLVKAIKRALGAPPAGRAAARQSATKHRAYALRGEVGSAAGLPIERGMVPAGLDLVLRASGVHCAVRSALLFGLPCV
jgi:hypothetical protein